MNIGWGTGLHPARRGRSACRTPYRALGPGGPVTASARLAARVWAGRTTSTPGRRRKAAPLERLEASAAGHRRSVPGLLGVPTGALGAVTAPAQPSAASSASSSSLGGRRRPACASASPPAARRQTLTPRGRPHRAPPGWRQAGHRGASPHPGPLEFRVGGEVKVTVLPKSKKKRDPAGEKAGDLAEAAAGSSAHRVGQR